MINSDRLNHRLIFSIFARYHFLEHFLRNPLISTTEFSQEKINRVMKIETLSIIIGEFQPQLIQFIPAEI